MMKKAAALLLALLLPIAGVALAEEDGAWDTRAYLAYCGQGENDLLLSLIQPIDRTYESATITAYVPDVVFDGHVVTMALTITNKADEPLLLVYDEDFGDANNFMTGSYNVDQRVLQPGETRNCGIDAEISSSSLHEYGDGAAPMPTCEVKPRFTTYRLTGELITIESSDYAEHEAANDYGEAQAALGNVVINEWGDVQGANVVWQGGLTRTESLDTSGLFAEPTSLNIALTVKNNAQSVSLLPDGEPVEQEMDGFVLRVSRADMTPNALILDIEKVFTEQEAAEAYGADGRMMGFAVLDETNGHGWCSSSGGNVDNDMPAQNALGEWILGYRYMMMNINRIPQRLRLVPVDVDMTGVEYPDGGITLVVRAM